MNNRDPTKTTVVNSVLLQAKQYIYTYINNVKRLNKLQRGESH